MASKTHNAIKDIVLNTTMGDAAPKTERFGKHHEWLIEIDADHTAMLTMDDEAYEAFVKVMNLEKTGD